LDVRAFIQFKTTSILNVDLNGASLSLAVSFVEDGNINNLAVSPLVANVPEGELGDGRSSRRYDVSGRVSLIVRLCKSTIGGRHKN
jgi:hypothetical protein